MKKRESERNTYIFTKKKKDFNFIVYVYRNILYFLSKKKKIYKFIINFFFTLY